MAALIAFVLLVSASRAIAGEALYALSVDDKLFVREGDEWQEIETSESLEDVSQIVAYGRTLWLIEPRNNNSVRPFDVPTRTFGQPFYIPCCMTNEPVVTRGRVMYVPWEEFGRHLTAIDMLTGREAGPIVNFTNMPGCEFPPDPPFDFRCWRSLAVSRSSYLQPTPQP